MDDGALDDALEAGGRLGILAAVGDQVVQFAIRDKRRDSRRSFSKSTLQARITAAAS